MSSVSEQPTLSSNQLVESRRTFSLIRPQRRPLFGQTSGAFAEEFDSTGPFNQKSQMLEARLSKGR